MMKSFLFLLILTVPLSAFAGEDNVKLLIPEFTIHEASSKWVYRNLKDESQKIKQTYKETDLDEFVNRFERKGYKVDKIEIWVEGVAATSGVTKLMVSLEGKGGMKVILNPDK